MSSEALICANNNEFNKAILGYDAYYFHCKNCITPLFEIDKLKERSIFVSNNISKIREKYSWNKINSDYEHFMISTLSK